MAAKIFVGCAGWSLPKQHAARFPVEGTHLTRYAGSLPAVEINSSFYKPHRPATYAKWAASVPDGFRFAVKLPKEATHVQRLVDAECVLDLFLTAVAVLGVKLGPLLVQLPPSLHFASAVAERFFKDLRERFAGDVVVEPRHTSWFAADAEGLLRRYRIARVAADPAVVPIASEPGGSDGLVYYRLHGSPKTYYSDYSQDDLTALTAKISAARSVPVWCIFDNTAAGCAAANALDLLDRF